MDHPLSVDFEACYILPMRPLNDYPTIWYPVFLESWVGGRHHCNVDPTTDIDTCFGVGLLSLGGVAAGQVFQHGLRLGTQETIHQDNKR